MTDYSFKLPDLGEGIVESEIAEWHVKVGDEVTEDQHIADVMTDKAMVEVTSPVSGTVKKLACKAGEVLAVGTELILFQIGEKAADNLVEDSLPAVDTESPTTPVNEKPSAPALKSKSHDSTDKSDKHQVLASPSVRRRAREQQIDLSLVSGTGRSGRISNTDLDNFIAAGGQQVTRPVQQYPEKKFTTKEVQIRGLRRKIAQKMTESSKNIPHYSYVEEIDVTALEEIRHHLNEHRKEGQEKLTLLPFIMLSIVKVIPDFPHCNAHYNAEEEILTQHEAAHIGIATMTDNGLLVPVVKNVEALDIWHAASALKELTVASREGRAQSSDLSGSTITITSLGAIGGIVTTPIINAPETTIVGVNKLQERAVVRDGEIVIRKIMNLSSSFDHRIVDGYDGALFVQQIKRLLENPVAIFV